MNVLVTGGSGLLGKSLAETKPTGINLKSTWYTNCIGADYQLDVCNKSQVNYICNLVQPDVIIHCAANGSVDYAEKAFTEVRNVNVEGTKNIARAAYDWRAKLVFISTNAVFQGDKPPYREDADRQPVNRYGSIKREAEDRITELNHWLIIRPFLLYGWPYKNARPNWFVTVLNTLTDKRQLKLVNDVWWQPTNARDCATAIWHLIEKKNEIYHVATDDRVTLYEFALTIANMWGYDGEQFIKPIASNELKGIAPRPVDTTYDLTKLHDTGLTLMGIEEGLKSLQ